MEERFEVDCSRFDFLQLSTMITDMYTVSQKNCTFLFLSELRQISTNFNMFWYLDGKVYEIVRYIYIVHLT